MKGFFVIGLLLVGGQAFAVPYTVQDPSNLLGQLDDYLNAGSFADAFNSGDLGDYTRLFKDPLMACSPSSPGVLGGCIEWGTSTNEDMTRTVTAVSATQATITLDDGTTQVWTPDQYASLHGNAVRYDLPLLNFNFDGYLEASTLGDRSYTTPAGQTIAGKEIVFLFHPQGFEDQTFMVRYTVAPGLPIAGQILQMAAFGQWFYQLKSINRQ